MTEPISAAMSAALIASDTAKLLDEIIRAVVSTADPALMKELRAEYAQRKDSIHTVVRLPQGVS